MGKSPRGHRIKSSVTRHKKKIIFYVRVEKGKSHDPGLPKEKLNCSQKLIKFSVYFNRFILSATLLKKKFSHYFMTGKMIP